ncbi:MAG: Peptidase rane alanine aminopeptidase [Chitinophagaceae bacterium]|nr:Peptidase rane alanine aminopeptidase [Chitinophagaceae bacterium]
MKTTRLLLTLLVFAISCNQKTSQTDNVETEKDPHTFSEPDKAVVKHLDLDIKVNFDTKQISGKASWSINNIAKTDHIIFDTKLLEIQKVTVGADEKETKFSFGATDSILGKPLQIEITDADTLVHIYYTTSKDAGALQWLEPQQTLGKKQPFLFTQSEPILARSWVPSQDGPGIRFTYNATVSVPKELLVVMSAENPQQKNADGVYHFKQTHPIPSYLLALAVGDLAFKPVDERTGVYAEPAMLEKAAWEFADMGKMVNAAEKLYGPYRWGRYDVLVLPPSFPYGGMENPNLTFATPTVIAGDRSLVSLVAHELAHSWSGNLVTNATWNDMWLNEGFTTYFQQRITEAVYGAAEAKMQEVLSRQALTDVVKEKGATSKDTKLKGDYKGRDPDEGSSDIVYDKGYAFLQTIEAAAGREKFDAFLKDYFNTYAFQSRNTEQFVDYLNKELIKGDKALAGKIMVNEWVYQPGIPKNIPPSVSEDFNKIDSAIANLRKMPVTGLHQRIKSTNELLYFLSHLPAGLTTGEMVQLDKEFNFTPSGNSEVQAAWYVLAIHHQYHPADAYIEKFLTEVGRRKFLRPLYKEMIKTPDGKAWAQRIYAKARANYHPVSYTTIDELLK